MAHARPGLVIAAFAAIYLIWGSTYLAIKLAIDTLPPLLMAGSRFLVAGPLLWLIVPGSRRTVPTRRDWLWAFVLGAFLLLIGNGVVTVVEGKMPSAVAALLITSVPLWMALLDWLAFRGPAPTGFVGLGILLGFGGVILLAGEDGGWVGGEVDYRYVVAILLGCLCWATGSLLSRRGGIKLPILRSVALQMFAGGILLTAAGLLSGEWAEVDLANASASSAWAWLYLVVFGSVIAFSAYSWLLSVRPSAMVSTYAFVNPVVAVLLGAAWLDEPITQRTVVASTLIVAAVALVTYAKSRKAAAPPLKPVESMPSK
ncbi:MAG: EamA family transporter [Candidatus Thermoplasmatota archaeon]